MDVLALHRLHGAFRFILLCSAACLLQAQAGAANPKIDFNVPAGDLSGAIVEMSRQSHVAILYFSLEGVSATGIRTRAVVGRYELREALTLLLKGTGCAFEFENPRSVIVKPKSAPSGPPPVKTDIHPPQLPTQANYEHAAVEEAMTEITVTGSLIRGVVDIVSPLVSMKWQELKRTPYATVQDALQTLPANFGGPSEDFAGSSGNFESGSGINLRGLGSGATLVLVNGQRQPYAGLGADFVDVSLIPWSMVERIEVLPDGASALYGSDAIAGVVNVILREDLDGWETQARRGFAPGGGDETLAAQLFGKNWQTGKVLVAYQYAERTALPAASRPYAAQSDKRRLGGSNYDSVWSNPGNILDPGTGDAILGIPDGQDGTGLRPIDLLPDHTNFKNTSENLDLWPDRHMHAVYARGSQEFGSRLTVFGEGRLSKRYVEQSLGNHRTALFVPASNPFFVDAYGGAPFVLVGYDFGDDLGSIYSHAQTRAYTGTLGITARFGETWQATATAFYGNEQMRWRGYNLADIGKVNEALADDDPRTAFNPFGAGSHTNPETIRSIRMIQNADAKSDVSVGNLIADGTLLNLPAGDVKLAIGGDHRQENLWLNVGTERETQHWRATTSAFGEFAIPIVGEHADERATPRLQLSLALRGEHYSDFGTTVNPKIGVQWAPLASVKLRSSWGTSFRAPTLVDLYDTSQNAALLIPTRDPGSPVGFSTVLFRQGNNPDLSEETASVLSTGIDIAPRALPGLTLSLTYYEIDSRDRTFKLGLPGGPTTLDEMYLDPKWDALVTRNPSDDLVREVCARPDFLGTPAECVTNAPAAIIDVRARNLGATEVRGIDLELEHLVRTRFGAFDLSINGGYLLRFAQALTTSSPMLDRKNRVGSPPGFRVRGSLGWSQVEPEQPGFGVSITADYTKDYRDDASALIPRISSSTIFDLQLTYRTKSGEDWMADAELGLSAWNFLNSAPPFVDRSRGYDTPNADPNGRLIGLYLRKNW